MKELISAAGVVQVALGFVAILLAVIVVHSIWNARKPSCDPLPPDEPEHHAHH